jgi:hypothetical protein
MGRKQNARAQLPPELQVSHCEHVHTNRGHDVKRFLLNDAESAVLSVQQQDPMAADAG